jgi:hypothetical protein
MRDTNAINIFTTGNIGRNKNKSAAFQAADFVL